VKLLVFYILPFEITYYIRYTSYIYVTINLISLRFTCSIFSTNVFDIANKRITAHTEIHE